MALTLYKSNHCAPWTATGTGSATATDDSKWQKEYLEVIDVNYS